jgi:hypothetical protein
MNPDPACRKYKAAMRRLKEFTSFDVLASPGLPAMHAHPPRGFEPLQKFIAR